MNKGIFFALYRNLIDINANFCCLCYNHVSKETACVQDFIVLSLKNDHDAKKCSNYEEVGIHYILQQILGSRVAAYLSEKDPICDKCMRSAIDSYKFIQMCQGNNESMANSVGAFTSNIDLTEGIEMQDYKTIFMLMDFEDSKYTQYYDAAKFTDSDAALYKFQTLFRPFRAIKDKKGNTKYKCTKCQSVFLIPINALKHFSIKHNEDQELSMTDEMNNCLSDVDNETYTDNINKETSVPGWTDHYDSSNIKCLNELSLEVIKDCVGVNKYKCSKCNIIFATMNSAHQHYEKNHFPQSETDIFLSSKDGLLKAIKVGKTRACSDKLENSKTMTKKQKPHFLIKFKHCRYYIKRLNELSHTVIKDSDGIIKYKCRECTSILSNQHSARYHYMMYHVEKIEFAEESVIKEDDIITKTKSKKNNAEDKFTCNYCNENYDNKYFLIEHILKEHAVNNSEICQTPLQDIHLLKNDIRNIYNHIYTIVRDDNGCEMFCCKLCLKLFKNFQIVKYHFDITHVKPLEKDQYICSQCGKVYMSIHNLNKHEKCHKELSHEVIKDCDGLNKYKCRQCNSTFSNIYRAHKHYKEKHVPQSEAKKSVSSENELQKGKKRGFFKNNETKRKKQKLDFLIKFKHCKDYIKHINKLSHTTIKDSSGIIKYKCRECASILSSQHTARNHYIMHHVEKTKFVEESVKKDDILTKTKSKTNIAADKFTCNNCNENYDNKYILIEHMLKEHAVNSSEICETPLQHIHLLENDISGQKNIYNHIYTTVRGENGCEDFCCKLCLKLFKNFQAVKYHFNITHVKPLEKDQYICSQCGKGFKTIIMLNKHEKCHTDSKVTCEICYKEFSNQCSLKRHKISLNGNCFLSIRERLAQKLESNSQMFTCDICKKAYINKNSLRQHIKRHDPYAIKFPCLHCPKVFHNKTDLKYHQITHTKEKNFTCSVCGDVFCAKNALVYHTRIHTGERPYECTYCDMRFLNASRRMDHVRRHHIAATAQCSVCGITIKQAGMRKHMRRHQESSSKEARRNVSVRLSGTGKAKVKV